MLSLIVCGFFVFSTAACESSSSAGGTAPSSANPPVNRQSQPPAPVTGADATVARVGAVIITREQLSKPLIEAHGLKMTLSLTQLEMARQEAKAGKLIVSPGDIQTEEDRTLDRMFADQRAEKSDYPNLLEQFLERRNMSPIEWKMLMETNATLRKLAGPKASGAIKDDQLNEAFLQLYGEKVQVRHIQCSNLQEIAEVRRRIAAGETFEQAAKVLSRNSRTGPLGGELPPFTRQSAYPQAFKDAAFAMKAAGEVSDPVQAEGAYHLIQMQQRIAPKVIKFEDVKGSIREDLEEKLIQQLMQELRQQLSELAARSLIVSEPTLKAQYAVEQQRREKQVRDREEIRKEIDREREKAATQQAIPDLVPAPGGAPATKPG